MKVVFAAALLLAGGTSFLAARKQPDVVTPFHLVLEHTVHGWSATCDSGCQWTHVGFKCATECAAIIDNIGLRTEASGPADSVTFSFHVRQADSGNGWQADSAKGTAWTALSWHCKSGTCPAQVNGFGVTGPRP